MVEPFRGERPGLEVAPDLAEEREERRRAWLTFVVVGSGPTGVEMAGQIAEIAHDTLRRDFRTIDPRATRILLVEAAERVLTGFPERLSARAARALERLGVTAGDGGPDLTLPGHLEVFALGDMVGVRDEQGDAQPLPGVAPVAMQQRPRRG